MNLRIIKIKESINKAYLRLPLTRSQLESFKGNLEYLFKQVKDSEGEEFHKNEISEFLKKTYYSPNHYINTKGRYDLVIHNNKDSKSSVGVIVECKSPGNVSEMPTVTNLNSKAIQELILYFLQERITNKNLELKHLIATNLFEWFIFDAHEFEKHFANNKQFVKQFTDFEEGRLSGKDNPFFYNTIASPFLEDLETEVNFNHFDLKDYKKLLKSNTPEDDIKLIPLYKILSPEHILKLQFKNDSNSLDKNFYHELLHIIGLAETKEGSKKIIKRASEKTRNYGTLLEGAITILKAEDLISQIPRPSDFGDTQDEQLFNISLELVITWINRILFLKLLEGQLIKYNNGDKNFGFLHQSIIPGYDSLNKLFFQVLAIPESERDERIRDRFTNIPYLNSSLFEPTDLERRTIRISNLDDENKLPIYKSTVLKDTLGKKIVGERATLTYLLDFLDSYNFSSEGIKGIQEENKTLINASVLGLIFEKINGYKDGSFFTPGFITQYMCHETITKAVVQKFNEVKGWNCETLVDIHNKVEDKNEANKIINSLRICDPAVGSGHFLVSSLNEILSIKSELKILSDAEGKVLRDYHFEVINDELLISDQEGEPFKYNPKNRESQRVQETVFHEKQTIIENCLFGVDINPNSVKICRLRLWIELLKHAYYKSGTLNPELETLPNIDINIKCGNSLISRYPLDADIKTALKTSKWTVENYREAVMNYRNAGNKEEKRILENLIFKIKNDFATEVSRTNQDIKALNKYRNELLQLTSSQLFEYDEQKKNDWRKRHEILNLNIEKYELKISEIKNNKVFENAFEWRFEFPEVLNNDGDFVGFDVLIGNPPYGVELTVPEKEYLRSQFESFHTRWTDTFNYFISKSLDLVRVNSWSGLIIPNNFLFQNEYEKSRKSILNHVILSRVINLGGNVFEDAEVPTCIILFKKQMIKNYTFGYLDLRAREKTEKLFHDPTFVNYNKQEVLEFSSASFGIDKLINTIQKRNFKKIILIDSFAQEVANGIQPTGDKIFRIPIAKAVELRLESELLKKVLVGSDFNRFSINYTEHQVIYTTKSVDINKYPNCLNYLERYKSQLLSKRETKKGILPWWCLHWPRYRELFEDDKIILRQTSDCLIAALDNDGYYAMNNVIILKIKENNPVSYKFLLGLLNSKLLNFIYRQITQEENRVFAEVKPINIRKLPIILPDKERETRVTELVTTILLNKKSDHSADTTFLESAIDQMVYELYGLTEEEIKKVENKL